MPRQKRPLSEANANASPTRVDQFSSKTNAELISMLKDRGLPQTGKKADLVARLEEFAGTSCSSNGESQNATANGSSKNIEYMTMCRPFEDIVAEKRASGEEYDSDEAEDINPCGGNACMCKQPLKDHPEWNWIISKEGFETLKYMQKEAMHRDQDFMGEYHFNDFSGYGFQEMVNNQLLAFHKEYRKNNPDPFALWYLITGFAHILPGTGAWFHCDDGEQIAATMRLLGYAILATGDVLKRNGLVKADSEIKDMSLVLAMCLVMVQEWDGFVQEDELDWRVPMINQAEGNGVKLSGPFGIEDHVAKLKEEYDGEEADWINFDWNKKIT